LDLYWRRHPEQCRDIPIFFSAGITTQSNSVYRHYLSYLNETIQESYLGEGVDAFSFPCIQPYNDKVIDMPGPCVVLATPGMLLSGLSLEIFSKWAPDEKNIVVLPGYCQPGSAGNKVLAGQKRISADLRGQPIEFDVRCGISHMSFSAHADATGIMAYIRAVQPRAVVLVHGEREKMPVLAARIINELQIPAQCPSNYTMLTFAAPPTIPARIDAHLLQLTMNDKNNSIDIIRQRVDAAKRQREKLQRKAEAEEGEAVSSSDDEAGVDDDVESKRVKVMDDGEGRPPTAYIMHAKIQAADGLINITAHERTHR